MPRPSIVVSERGGEPAFERVAILGVGLIGGSFGMALKARGLAARVTAYSRTPATRRLAVERGAADECPETPQACVEGADLVYLATPVASLVPCLKEVADHLAHGVIVTDAGSSKQAVVAAMESLGVPGMRFVGGHPMTGSEAMGVEHARADLFEGMTYAVTPSTGSDPAAVEAVADLAAALGSRVVRLDPAAHDEAVAAISHLPHLLATALMMVTDERAKAGEPVYDLTAGSWSSATRVAASGAGLWREIFASNRAAVLRAVADCEAALGGLRETLTAGDDEALEALLDAARRAKLAHPGK